MICTHWLLGVFFMLAFTCFLRLVRGALRPGALPFLRHPAQEQNPVLDMAQRPLLAHMARLAASALLYAGESKERKGRAFDESNGNCIAEAYTVRQLISYELYAKAVIIDWIVCLKACERAVQPHCIIPVHGAAISASTINLRCRFLPCCILPQLMLDPASARVPAGLCVLLVRLPAILLRSTVPHLFPLRLGFLDPFAQIPADVLLFHICLPFAIEHMKLRVAVKAVLGLWLRAVGRLLGLTAYLLPEDEADDDHLPAAGDNGAPAPVEGLNVHAQAPRLAPAEQQGPDARLALEISNSGAEGLSHRVQGEGAVRPVTNDAGSSGSGVTVSGALAAAQPSAPSGSAIEASGNSVAVDDQQFRLAAVRRQQQEHDVATSSGRLEDTQAARDVHLTGDSSRHGELSSGPPHCEVAAMQASFAGDQPLGGGSAAAGGMAGLDRVGTSSAAPARQQCPDGSGSFKVSGSQPKNCGGVLIS